MTWNISISHAVGTPDNPHDYIMPMLPGLPTILHVHIIIHMLSGLPIIPHVHIICRDYRQFTFRYRRDYRQPSCWNRTSGAKHTVQSSPLQHIYQPRHALPASREQHFVHSSTCWFIYKLIHIKHSQKNNNKREGEEAKYGFISFNSEKKIKIAMIIMNANELRKLVLINVNQHGWCVLLQYSPDINFA